MTLEVASIRLTAEIGLPSILGDSEDGLGIQEIAEKTGVDSLKLGSFRCHFVVDQNGERKNNK